MASETSTPVASGGNIEVLSWLKNLPVAPEYHPTLAEFQDPIAYIFKIEKEASQYGICKIVPPVPAQSKKTFLSNLNKSLSARSGTGTPTFTTRQQQIGFCPRKHHPVQKPVWQSGGNYTLEEFEAKAEVFEKNYLRKCSKKNLTALEVETLYWKAVVDKPFQVEYANDMPGSAFAVRKAVNEGDGEGINANASIAETEWNMRGVSRAKGSLLKVMKEEIPGVTSPMVYVAMMFSWFAWHVEDHDLHSLNYMHTGAGKTWYGVPRDAASAFEEVIRAHGYGGEINPLVTFATLGEKNTVMSPEVLVDAGVPCCRLVQNAGEFVVTFPRAYHSGFSHGLNCGEAANIATPGWLTVATEAAIRRASINCPPMVSHFQLLYDLVLSCCSSVAKNVHFEPRSSRLKDKKRGEGEMLVKDLFIQDVLQNSNLLHMLAKGSPVIILPKTSSGGSFCSQTRKSSFLKEGAGQKGSLEGTGSFSMKDKYAPLINDKRLLCSVRSHETSLASESKNMGSGQDRPSQADRSSDQGLFSCVTCGILCFACVAIVQPTDVAARYLVTADCSQFKEWAENSDRFPSDGDVDLAKSDSFPVRWRNKRNRHGLFDVPVEAADPLESTDSHIQGPYSNDGVQKSVSSLGLLALAYGNSSDSEEDDGESVISNETCQIKHVESSGKSELDCHDNVENVGNRDIESYLEINVADGVPLQVTRSDQGNTSRRHEYLDGSFEHDSCRFFKSMDSGNLADRSWHQIKSQDASANCSTVEQKAGYTMTAPLEHFRNKNFPHTTRPDEDSSRMHVFCLQHAVQVEKQLRSIGGAHVLLLCHPDYLKVEDHAKKMAEEFVTDYAWNGNSYRQASQEDEEIIKSALQSEEALHGNGDWAVKLGMNLFYCANLSRSPLYCKQMPYNYVIYSAFGRSSPMNDLTTEDSIGRGQGRQRKILVAGKWCGKVWMSNQVHPLLVKRDLEEEQQRKISSRTKHGLRTVLKSDWETDVKPEKPLHKSRILTAETTSIGVKRERSLRKSRILTGEMSSIGSKTGKKRKTTAELRTNIKVEEQGKAFEDSSINLSFILCKSNQRKKRTAWENPEPLDRGVKNRKQSNLEPLDRGVKNRKQSNLEPLASCVKNRKQSNLEPLGRGVKNRKQLNLEPVDRGVKNIKQLNLEPLDRGVKNRKQLKNLEPLDSGVKNRKQLNLETEEREGGVSSRLRIRPVKPGKDQKDKSDKPKPGPKKPLAGAKPNKSSVGSSKGKLKDEKAEYLCDLEGCTMSFGTKQELVLHKRNICPVKGCGKKFSHKYLVQHRRVHMDDRPLKCPWKGCKMSFKWAWARTEHIRVHTGARPYVCDEAGCGQTFRFVSDFSRHKRKTGHCVTKRGRG